MRTEREPLAHFWTRREDAASPWDPDREPALHLNAYGHAFLELFWRLHAAGRRVTIGPNIPQGAAAVVVSFEELSNYQPQVPNRLMARLAWSVMRMRAMPRVAILRVDTALTVSVPSFTTLEVMATQAAVRDTRQIWLPLLPQRGMVHRDATRGDRIEVIAIKAYSYNVPAWADDEFARRLRTLGMTLRIDTEEVGGWHDFRDVDVVLCTQRLDASVQGAAIDERRKPPTKLVNAWNAGAIPLCGDHVGYREIGVPEVDTLFVEDNTADACLAALRRLKEDPEHVRRMRQSIAARAQEYSPPQILEATWNAVLAARPASRIAVAGEGLRAVLAEVRDRARHVGHAH